MTIGQRCGIVIIWAESSKTIKGSNMKIVNKIIKTIWVLAGVLVIVVMVIAICIGLDIKETTTEIRDIGSQANIDDMRTVIGVIEKQLDKDILSLQLQQDRTSLPLEWTVENWQDYLNFCEEYGYVISDYTWQEYRYGRLVP